MVVRLSHFQPKVYLACCGVKVLKTVADKLYGAVALSKNGRGKKENAKWKKDKLVAPVPSGAI